MGIVGVRLAVRGEGGSATTLLRLMVKSVGGCCWRLGHGLVQERTEAGTECLSLGDGKALSWAHSYYFRFPIDAFQSSHIQSPSWELVHSLTPRYGILSYKEHHLTPLGRPPSSLPTTHAPISRYPPMFSIWSSPRHPLPSGDRQLLKRVSSLLRCHRVPLQKIAHPRRTHIFILPNWPFCLSAALIIFLYSLVRQVSIATLTTG